MREHLRAITVVTFTYLLISCTILCNCQERIKYKCSVFQTWISQYTEIYVTYMHIGLIHTKRCHIPPI